MAKCSHCCSLQLSWAACAWDTNSRSGSCPNTHLSPGTASQGVPARQTLSFTYSQTQFPLPLLQPAAIPQSQSTSSLYTRLPPEEGGRSLTCTPRLQKRDINFHFSPKDTTFSLSYWMLQWLHLKSWAFSSIPLPRVMQSLSFHITQCICNQAVSWL